MKGKRFREEQIIEILKEAGLAVAELVRMCAIAIGAAGGAGA
jgi:hypothetical protein